MKELRSNLILTQALLVSGGLNMVFIALFYFMVIQEGPLYLTFNQVKAASMQAKDSDTKISQILAEIQALPMEELIPYLENETLLEDGFKTRDIALALLIEKHHFDLKRAILGLEEPKQQRLFKIASNESISHLTLYPDLTSSHYKAITEFARQEKWPLTAEGLALAGAAPIEPPLVIVKEEAPPQKTHIVQEGESLWRISRQYKIDIDTLRAHNHLSSDRIRPGQTLRIP